MRRFPLAIAVVLATIAAGSAYFIVGGSTPPFGAATDAPAAAAVAATSANHTTDETDDGEARAHRTADAAARDAATSNATAPITDTARSEEGTADSPAAERFADATSADAPTAETPRPQSESQPDPEKIVPLNRQKTVFLDKPGNRVLLKSKVVLRKGLLEMLVCRTQTKEHESILAVDTPAQVIHAGLLALGAEPGEPVRYIEGEDPETGAFQLDVIPPKGQRIDIFLQWTDKQGKLHRVPAQKWIRTSTHRFHTAELDALPAGVELPRDGKLRFDAKHDELSWYGEMKPEERDAELKRSGDEKFQQAVKKLFADSRPRPMTAHWVFAGSMYQVDEQTGEKSYLAEVGDVICVANFASALLDVAEDSSASGDPTEGGNGGLQYEADTDAIPPLETEVTVELIPVAEKQDAASDDDRKSSPNPQQ
ncbi:MAG: YdjY domain-containing protein [Planctomycetaceae bacterium]